MIKVGDLYKQGTCLNCGVALFGTKPKLRKFCGLCKEGFCGLFEQKKDDHDEAAGRLR